MSTIPVIAIFDVGKTNKKLFLFDENYKIVYEKSARFTETKDEDSFPCENIDSLTQSVFDSFNEVLKLREFELKAVNFSTYGASFVHLDENGNVIAPLYNYLKKYPEGLQDQFYNAYGGEARIAIETSSPALGNLNSGLQLYWLKYHKGSLFSKIKYSLHLPQYLSYLLTNQPVSDITSVGCHTALWDFSKNDYHEWVYQEGIADKLAPLVSSETTFENNDETKKFVVGVGLHDSSAALIPYLVNFSDPFVLISTGTWCITLNPFNNDPLTTDELKQDCLCYIQYKGAPVKASRLFAGNEHEIQIKRIADHFNINTWAFKYVEYDKSIIKNLASMAKKGPGKISEDHSVFAFRDLNLFQDHIEAYHQLMVDIMDQQYRSTKRILNSEITRRIFVDGGFSKNSVYMNLLAKAFPNLEVFAASMAQATAVGTAIAIHDSWNSKPLPNDLIELKYYSTPQTAAL